MISYLATGVLLGLAAGISPGPLLALVITETLKYSKAEGIKVAVAPLITDLPIIFVSVLLLAQLENNNSVLAVISFIGMLFIGYLAYENLTSPGLRLDNTSTKSQSLKKGILANFLSPHPYLFWVAVGAPITVKAFHFNALAAALFIGGFYLCLVGSKVLLALLIEHAGGKLNETGYRYTLRALGIVLFIFAALFLREGLLLLQK